MIPADRRRFLTITAAALAAAGATGITARRLWRSRTADGASAFRATLAAQLRERFAYLRCEAELFERFLDDLERHLPVLARHAPSNRIDVFARFLLSTDFFRTGADPTRPLRYVTFYDPYVTPCHNPLRRPP